MLSTLLGFALAALAAAAVHPENPAEQVLRALDAGAWRYVSGHACPIKPPATTP